jgi:hypothetical protein
MTGIQPLNSAPVGYLSFKEQCLVETLALHNAGIPAGQPWHSQIPQKLFPQDSQTVGPSKTLGESSVWESTFLHRQPRSKVACVSDMERHE